MLPQEEAYVRPGGDELPGKGRTGVFPFTNGVLRVIMALLAGILVFALGMT